MKRPGPARVTRARRRESLWDFRAYGLEVAAETVVGETGVAFVAVAVWGIGLDGTFRKPLADVFQPFLRV